MRELLAYIDTKLTSLPATAQRAHQQGYVLCIMFYPQDSLQIHDSLSGLNRQYLARKFNKLAQASPGMVANDMYDGDLDAAMYKAFHYKHLGSLAYIGNAAVFDYNGWTLGGGLVAVYLWRYVFPIVFQFNSNICSSFRSVYFAQSVSPRTRILLAMDWSKRALFGRGKNPVFQGNEDY